MTRIVRSRAWMRWALVALAAPAFAVLLTSEPVFAQARGRSPRSGGSPSGGGQSGGSTGGNSGGGRAVPRSGPTGGGDGGTRTGGGTTSGPNGGTTARGADGRDGSDPGATPADHAAPRDGQPRTGRAVPRPAGPRGGPTTVIVDGGYFGGGYYPWGYGGIGFGGYDGYGGGWGEPWPGDEVGEGAVRLKIKPRDALVYVDGYFAGAVDEFDGVFQRLRVEAGAHHVEVRMDGFEPLALDVMVLPDRTTTYSGELRKLP